MGIYCKARIRGEKGEVEAEAFLNSGSDYSALPRKVAEKISPTPVGEEEFMLADGSRVRRKVYKVEVELEDSKGKRKRCKALTTIEEREDVLIGFEVMRELKLILNSAKEEAYFS